MKRFVSIIPYLFLLVISTPLVVAQSFTAKLDKNVQFYQSTALGVVIVGTDKSLYALDGSTGEVLWRRKDVSLDETDVAPVPGTDLVLLSFEKGDKSRVEAADLLTGASIWRSEKLKGAVMQVAVEPADNLIAVVLAKAAKSRAREGFKRHPLIHVLTLSSGDELWKYEVGEVEMMPTRWPDDESKEVEYTFDNYYPPAFADGRLFVFYEGVTSFEARNGKERLRERYRVNEEGLALTEARPIFSDQFIYTSGRGHVRAISRANGDTIWEAKDLGLTPELLLVDNVLYARTGGQFTRLRDGETVEKGAYGVSAINAQTGKVLWRYKGADKGITNLLMPAANRLAIADRDELILVDAGNGKRLSHTSHRIDHAAFALINENGNVVVGGQSEIAAFEATSGREIWRARHSPPGRGLIRTIAAIAARAASLYFRFGGTAITAVRGVQIARGLSSLSWSGLATRSSFSNLQTMATRSTGTYVSARLTPFGIAARAHQPGPGNMTNITRGRTSGVEERLLDRLDPAHQLDRISRYLWHRERLAALRGQWMYFYTELSRDGRGLAGVNINNGQTLREVRLSNLDERFVTDEVLGVMYVANDNKIVGYPL